MVDMSYVKSACLASWLVVLGPSEILRELFEQPPGPIDV